MTNWKISGFNQERVKKGNWSRLLYRMLVAVIALASIAFGVRGVVEQELSSGRGSWAKGPWQIEGGGAIVLGVVFVLFGLYLLIVLIRTR